MFLIVELELQLGEAADWLSLVVWRTRARSRARRKVLVLGTIVGDVLVRRSQCRDGILADR